MEVSCSRSSSEVGFDLGLIWSQSIPYSVRVGSLRQGAEIGQTIIGPHGSELVPNGQPRAGPSSQVTGRKCRNGPCSGCHHPLSYPLVRHGLASIIRGGRNRSLNVFNISKVLVDIRLLSLLCSSDLWVLPTDSDWQQEPLKLVKIGRGSYDNDLCLPNSFWNIRLRRGVIKEVLGGRRLGTI